MSLLNLFRRKELSQPDNPARSTIMDENRTNESTCILEARRAKQQREAEQRQEWEAYWTHVRALNGFKAGQIAPKLRVSQEQLEADLRHAEEDAKTAQRRADLLAEVEELESRKAQAQGVVDDAMKSLKKASAEKDRILADLPAETAEMRRAVEAGVALLSKNLTDKSLYLRSRGWLPMGVDSWARSGQGGILEMVTFDAAITEVAGNDLLGFKPACLNEWSIQAGIAKLSPPAPKPQPKAAEKKIEELNGLTPTEYAKTMSPPLAPAHVGPVSPSRSALVGA
jgi:hypothetical protein